MSDFDWLDDLRAIDNEIESNFLAVGKYRVRLISVAAETKVFAMIPHRFLVIVCEDQDNGKIYRRRYQVTDKAGDMSRIRMTIMGEQWLKAGLRTFGRMAGPDSQQELAGCPAVYLVCSERQGPPKPVMPGEPVGPPTVYKDEMFAKCDDQTPLASAEKGPSNGVPF